MSDSQPTHSSRPGKFVPPSLEALDSVLSAYEFIEVLGQGGMGAVYKVRQHSLDRIAAIKVMPKFEEEEGENFAERFQREARAMGRLTHSNIISVYDFGQTSDGMLYIVMEYVDGADLQQMMRTGEMTLDHLFDWIPQVCSALDYAHSQGIIHRDIKPGNIMIGRDGTVKVADFGLAKLTGGDGQHPRLTMTNMTMGTPDYVAPEALEMNVEADHRADIYAIGVMLYEMLTGKIPRGAWRPPSELNSHIDSRFDDLVTRAMDPEPESRFQNVSEISAGLSSIWATTDDSVPIIIDRKAKGSSGRRNTGKTSNKAGSKSNVGAWIGAGVTALAAIAGLIYFLDPGDSVDETELQITETDAQIGPDKSFDQAKKELPASPRPVRVESSPTKALPETKSPLSSTPKVSEVVKKPEDSPPVTKVPKPGTEVAGSRMNEKVPVNTSAAPAKSEVKKVTSSPASAVAMPAAPASKPISDGMRRAGELLNRYQSGYERTMLVPHEQSVASLDAQYLQALKRKTDSITASGNLDEVIAFRGEIERVENRKALPSSDDDLPPSLNRLRDTYRKQVGQLNEEHLDKVSTLISPLDSEFDSLEKELTKTGKVDDALEVRQERLRIQREGFPFVDLDTRSLFASIANDSPEEDPGSEEAQTSMNGPEITAAEAAAADRKAAEWALSHGGKVKIRIGENTVELQGQNADSLSEVAALLPANDFELLEVNLRGNRDITIEDFTRFPPSPNLRKLDLNETLFSDRASTRVLRRFPVIETLRIPHEGADEWAGMLSEVTTLREADFYRTLLTDDGARDLSKATNLTKLQLSESRITPRALDSIAKLTNLEELLLSNLNYEFGDEDLNKLSLLSKLTLLTLHKWKVTPEAIREFKKELPDCTIVFTNADGNEEKL